jgi:hypothetical protein
MCQDADLVLTGAKNCRDLQDRLYTYIDVPEGAVLDCDVKSLAWVIVWDLVQGFGFLWFACIWQAYQVASFLPTM